MSGGSLGGGGYSYHQINDLSDDVLRRIMRRWPEFEASASGSLDCIGDVYDRLWTAIKYARLTAAMLHRVDWLVSGDDSPKSFIARFDQDVTDTMRSVRRLKKNAMELLPEQPIKGPWDSTGVASDYEIGGGLNGG